VSEVFTHKLTIPAKVKEIILPKNVVNELKKKYKKVDMLDMKIVDKMNASK